MEPGPITARDAFLAGKFEGLTQAAEVLQLAVERGVPLQRVLVDLLDLADQVHVQRTMAFDEAAYEYVERRA